MIPEAVNIPDAFGLGIQKSHIEIGYPGWERVGAANQMKIMKP